MSVKVMTMIWERAPYTAGSLLVLLALADWANDEGVAWPSMESLAAKARMDKRSAQRIVRRFQKDGILAIEEGGGRARQHKYFIQIEKVANCHPLNSDAGVTVSGIKGDISCAETMTNQVERVAFETETVTHVSPDPLVDPLDKPSREPSQQQRGARLPGDFSINSTMRAWANQFTPHVNLDAALDEFRDYWAGVPGARGRKLDWVSTWRNRMRDLEGRATRNSNGANRQHVSGGHSTKSDFEFKPKAKVC